VRVLVGATTDVGRVRERNEDGFLTREPLFAVADGMGGHRGGAVASQVALEILSKVQGDSLAGDGAAEGLSDMVNEANDAVLERASGEPRLAGMGTTLTAVVVQPGKIHLAHVGDSRAYLLRDGSLRQLTEDHSLVQRMVNEGKLTPEEAEVHPHRSVLTRALGVEQELEVDTETVEVRPGDRILLCSDGLTTMIPEEEIQRIVAESEDPQRVAEALVAAANAAGGVDNITALVLFVLDGEEGRGDGESARAHERTPATATVGAPVAPAAESGAEPAPATTPAPAGETQGGTSLTQTAPGATGPEPGARPTRRRRPLRVVAWLVIVVAVLTAGVMGARAYVFSQWYVGVDGGRVALFQGMPVEILGYELHRTVEVTDLSATQAMELRPWSQLDEGITSESEEEARGIIETIRRDLAEAERQRRPGQGGSG
jgi:serine/threonine protein phosphatase PrpC